MTENLGENDFERRLFAMLESGEAQFPKGARRSRTFEAPPASVWDWLDRWAKPTFPRVVLSAAAAYALALVVSAPVYLLLLPRGEAHAPRPAPASALAAPEPALGSARRLELGAGPTRADGAEGRLTLAPGDSWVVLSFLVPIKAGARETFVATLEDGVGRALTPPQPLHSVDELGNFVLVSRSDLFSSGDYVLAVQETSAAHAGSSPTPRRFAFHVDRARH